MNDPLPQTPQKSKEGNKLVPIFFVLCLISFLSTTYVHYHLFPLVQDALDVEKPKNVNEAIWKCSIFGVSTFLLLYCYVKAIFKDPGGVPDTQAWKHCITNLGAEIAGFTNERKKDGDLRHCKWCAKYKPDRAHHCRVLGRCVLKMDHHCPWIYNTVGHHNHKLFFLILFYTCVDLWLIIITMYPTTHKILDNQKNSFMWQFVALYCLTMAAFIGLIVTAFFLFHVYLLLNNMTTIEYCEKRGGSADGGSNFSRGSYCRNISAALGWNPLFWLLPFTPADGNGLHYQWGGRANAWKTTNSPNMRSAGGKQQIVQGVVVSGNQKDKLVGHLPLDSSEKV